jgi:hypothetical protein
MSGSSTPPVPVTSLFTMEDAEQLRVDRLMFVARRYFPKVTLTNGYLFERLRVAEAELQRELRVLFTPRTILPDFALPGELAAAAAAGQAVLQEPGYDYDPSLFMGNSYGLIKLRKRPIISVQSICFNYPDPTSTFYTVPIEWVRPDKKYGIINLVPVNTASYLPLSAFILSVLGGGTTVPFMMQIRYTAGLQNAREEYPDLVDIIKKKAIVTILEDNYLPSSGSVSADGLSQSMTVDVDNYLKLIDKKTSRMRQYLSGIEMITI